MRVAHESRYLKEDYEHRLDWLLQEAWTRLNRLASIQSCLPPVDPDGHSECFDAEDRYAEKEEFEEKVRHDFKSHCETREGLEEEMRRLKRNLSLLQRGQIAMVHKEPLTGLFDGEEITRGKIMKVGEQLAQVRKYLDEAARVLAQSEKKKFPGRRPRRQRHSELTSIGPPGRGSEFPQTFSTPIPSTPSSERPISPPVDTTPPLPDPLLGEIGDLFRQGPVAGSETW